MDVLEAAVKGNQPDVLRRLLDLRLDSDERIQLGPIAERSWTASGPLFQAVILGRTEMVRPLLERGADPNAQVYAAGSPALERFERPLDRDRRMALGRIDWPRDDPRWFWMLWRPLPDHKISRRWSRPTHEAVARDHGAAVTLAPTAAPPSLGLARPCAVH